MGDSTFGLAFAFKGLALVSKDGYLIGIDLKTGILVTQ